MFDHETERAIRIEGLVQFRGKIVYRHTFLIKADHGIDKWRIARYRDRMLPKLNTRDILRPSPNRRPPTENTRSAWLRIEPTVFGPVCDGDGLENAA